MTLTTIFSLFLNQQDSEAKQLLTAFIVANNHAKQRIQDFLNSELTRVSTIESLEVIEIFSHFSDLSLISKVDGGTVEEVQLAVIDIEDLETYNRCGRREFKQVINPDLLSFYNNKTSLREVIKLSDISTHFKISH